MHFVLQTPSLQHLAGVKIVARLWTRPDVFNLVKSLPPITFYHVINDKSKWRMIEDVVKSKVRVLPLPERCKKNLADLIRPLGVEIIRWCHYYGEDGIKLDPVLDIFLPNQFCWTMRGTIDYAKTAELLVKDESVDLQRRFEVACISCLKVEARQLFASVAQARGLEFVYLKRYATRRYHPQLIRFFAGSIGLDVRHHKKVMQNYSTDAAHLFAATLPSANRKMCEYMYQIMKQKEKEKVFDQYPKHVSNCGVTSTCNLLYYLSLLSEEQRERMFEKRINILLKSLLRWPMQSLFTAAAERGWLLMSHDNRSSVLLSITRTICQGYQDYDYVRLFWGCWALSPVDYKEYYLSSSCYVYSLLDTGREEFVRLFLNEAPPREILALCFRVEVIKGTLIDDRVSEAALMECKQSAAVNSSNDEENVEKRLRSEHVSRLINLVLASRKKRRE